MVFRDQLLVVRVDANESIGTGHFMRCYALAQYWQASGGQVTFLSSCNNHFLLRRARNEGIRIVEIKGPHPDPADLEQARNLIAKDKPRWLILDGYHFDPIYQSSLVSESGVNLLIIDDSAHYDRYDADILVNQNLHGKTINYQCKPSTLKLIGPEYALLRSEFVQWQDRHRAIPLKARKLLITLGGSTGPSHYKRVMDLLGYIGLESIECDLIAGSIIAKDWIEARASQLPTTIRIHQHVEDISAFMATSDLALASSGSTTWEMAFMGLPMVLMVLSDNQESIARSLDLIGAAKSLGWLHQLDPMRGAEVLRSIMEDHEIRAKFSRNLTALVDGRGVERVVSAMRAYA